jgi:acyl carrier protein
MNKEQTLTELQEIFRIVFKNNSLIVNLQTGIEDLADWDSLMHVVLIDAVEKHFGIKFELGEMLIIEKVDDICNCILKKL